ncbi:hypothetical protein [Chlamydiifrater phoenicopteri]|uniref:hypothetical protein n=1 Tax=Chlamydiifrater phoenicopteri TaxID=2681469 RepID=UPI001BCE04DD|nr:hypothetical protein [Chlamydiifrater phoenicopteri]
MASSIRALFSSMGANIEADRASFSNEETTACERRKICQVAFLIFGMIFAVISATSLLFANFSFIPIFVSLISASLFLVALFKFFSISVQSGVMKEEEVLLFKEFGCGSFQELEGDGEEEIANSLAIEECESFVPSRGEKADPLVSRSNMFAREAIDLEELEDLFEYSELGKRGAKALVSSVSSSLCVLGKKVVDLLKDESFRSSVSNVVHRTVESVYVLAAGDSLRREKKDRNEDLFETKRT